MSNPLADAIREVLVAAPEFRKVAEQLPTIFGTITHFNEKTGKATVLYNDPLTNYEVTKSDVNVTCLRGLHNQIKKGDVAIVTFPYGYSMTPIILNVIPAEGEKHLMPGYMSTNLSQGC